MNTPESPNPLRWVIVLIVVSVSAWGVFHAIGAYRLNHNPARPLMVLGCVAAYLGFWGLMLRNRRNRLARQALAQQSPGRQTLPRQSKQR